MDASRFSNFWSEAKGRRKPPRLKQQGAFAISAGIMLLATLVMLGFVVDSGRLYLQQRELQKIVDLAAMETVARLPEGDCSAAPDDALQYATESALRHRFASGSNRQLTIECVKIMQQDGIRTATTDLNGRAVSVTASRRVPASLVMQIGALINDNISRNVNLSAVGVAARSQPAAAFSVGSQLLQLHDNLFLGQLLSAVGLDIDALSVLSSNGLATTSVTTAGLLAALGLDMDIQQLKALSPEELVTMTNAQVGPLSLEALLTGMIPLVSDPSLQDDLAELQNAVADNTILNAAAFQLLGIDKARTLLRLTSDSNETGAALDAEINLGELLSAALYAGMQQRGLTIPGMATLGVAQVQLGIVEPPAIGIGPVGTKAYNAQIRLYLDIDTNNLANGLLTWLTDNVLGTRIQLPIWIDLVTGQGTLAEIDCSTAPPSADIELESWLLDLCVGAVPNELKWSTSQSCDEALAGTELIRLLNQPVLTGKTHIPALKHSELLEDIAVDEARVSNVNPLALGDATDEVVGAVLDLLGGLFRAPVAVPDNDLLYHSSTANTQISRLAQQYLEETKNAAGFYQVAEVVNIVLNGSDEYDSDGQQILAPLVTEDWFIPKSIPTSCLLTVCPVNQWSNGTFSSAFTAYTQPGSLLDLLGLSTLPNGYQSCGGLLSSLLNWNNCIKHNLTKFLQEKPGGLAISASQDGVDLADPLRELSCDSALCQLLEPVLEQLKPTANSIGELLSEILNDELGIALGTTTSRVNAISCGAPILVQ